jgi:predicted Zn-dependent protease
MRRIILISIIVAVLLAIGGMVFWLVQRSSGTRLLAAAEVAIQARQFDKAVEHAAAYIAKNRTDWRGYEAQARALNFKGQYEQARSLIDAAAPYAADETARFHLARTLADSHAWPARQTLASRENYQSIPSMTRAIEQLAASTAALGGLTGGDLTPAHRIDIREYVGINASQIALAHRQVSARCQRDADADAKAGNAEQQKIDLQNADEHAQAAASYQKQALEAMMDVLAGDPSRQRAATVAAEIAAAGNDQNILAMVEQAVGASPRPSPDAVVLLARRRLEGLGEQDAPTRAKLLEEAAARIDLVLQQNPESGGALVMRAELALAQGDAAKADKLCQMALRRNARQAEARLLRARLLLMRGEAATAERELFTLKTELPRAGAPRCEYARAALANGHRGLARDALQEVLAMDADHAESRRMLASILLEDGVPAEAYAQAEAFYRLRPSDAAAVSLIAQTAAAIDRPQRIRQVIRETMDNYPTRADLLMAAREAALRLDDAALAQEALSKAAACPLCTNRMLELIALARARLASGRPAEAEQMLRDAIAASPKDARLQFELGGLYLATRRPLQGVEQLRNAVRLDGQQPAYRLALANALINIGQLPEAQQIAEELAADDARARRLLVQVRLLKGENPQQVLSGVSSADASGLAMAAVMISSGQPQRAVELCQAELKKPGGDDEAARSLLAEAYLAGGQDDAALAELARMLRAKPQDWVPYIRMAQVLIRGMPMDEAAGKIAAVESARGELVELAKGYMLLQLGRHADAAEQFGRLARRGEAPDELKDRARMLRAQALVLAGQTQQALLQLGEMSDKPAWAHQARYNSAEIMLALGQQAPAEDILQKLTADCVASEQITVLRQVAALYMKARRFQQAAAVARQVVDLRPREAASYALLAECTGAGGDAATAMELYHKAIELQPANAGLYLRLATILDSQQRRTEAMDTLRQLERLGPGEQATALFEQGQMFARWGLQAQAMDCYSRIASGGLASHPRLALALGEAMIRLGENDKARPVLQSVPAYSPQYVQAQLLLASVLGEREKLDALGRLGQSRPDDQEVAKATMNALLVAGRPKDAVAHFDKTVAALPRDAELAGDVAALAVQAMLAAGDRPAAAALTEKTALRLGGQSWHELAALMHVLDDPQKAAALLGPRDATSLDGAIIGMMADKQRKQDDSAKAWLGRIELLDQRLGAWNQPTMPPERRVLVALVGQGPAEAQSALAKVDGSGLVPRSAAADALKAAADSPREPMVLLAASVAMDMEQTALGKALALDALKARPGCQWAAAMAFAAETDPARLRSIADTLAATDSAQALIMRAGLLLQERKLLEAADAYGKAAAADGDNPHLSMRQAQALEIAGKLPEALEVYRRAYAATGRADAANAVAYLTSQLAPSDAAKLAQAQQLIDEALAKGGAGAWRDTRGWIRYLRSDYEAACADLRAACRDMPDSPELHYHLGAAEAAAGRKDMARWHLAAAMSLGQRLRASGRYVTPIQEQALQSASKELAKLN